MNLTAIIAFIFVFGILVIVHEFGHFFVAKKSGVLVREFAIGMGPKLLSWNRNNTAYTLRILPVGGYVRMAGLDEESDLDPGQRLRLSFNEQNHIIKIDTRVDEAVYGVPFQVDTFDLTDDLVLTGFLDNDSTIKTLTVDHDATIVETNGTEVQIAPRDSWIQSAKVYKRALINIAGPFMNFVLALVVFSGLAFALPRVTLNEPIIGTVQNNMPAEVAGLKSADRIIAINDKKVTTWNQVATTISTSKNKSLTFSVLRGDKTLSFKMVPKIVKVDGVNNALVGITNKTYTDIGSKIKYGVLTTGAGIQRIWYALTHLFSGGFSLDKLGGPVSIARQTSTVAKAGFLNILAFMAMLSLNLGIMNLIPIPALDGGKLVLNAIEALLRRPLPASFENAVTIGGAAFMFVLMIAVTINDLLR
ncbi:RIP metalloprotease RseP [Leuconostoc miyukkimchii]|uniref:RIP metalloprotease RseP n=1 Tax=Leuconostoc miyukkimchii TaxID=910540 RepID=UPI001C7D960C|nr:RIP metalloprotease RseP [Leuconostoc miyukkimchii]